MYNLGNQQNYVKSLAPINGWGNRGPEVFQWWRFLFSNFTLHTIENITQKKNSNQNWKVENKNNQVDQPWINLFFLENMSKSSSLQFFMRGAAKESTKNPLRRWHQAGENDLGLQ